MKPRLLIWLPTIAIMVLIFILSGQPADESTALSQGNAFQLANFLGKPFRVIK